MKILDFLKGNARIQWRTIGEAVHMSGQVVGERVKRLVANNIIEGYYTKINYDLLENQREDFVTVIMNSSNHADFLKFVTNTYQSVEVYRTSGIGCYLLKVVTKNQDELSNILDEILKYANYQVNSVMTKYK